MGTSVRKDSSQHINMCVFILGYYGYKQECLTDKWHLHVDDMVVFVLFRLPHWSSWITSVDVVMSSVFTVVTRDKRVRNFHSNFIYWFIWFVVIYAVLKNISLVRRSSALIMVAGNWPVPCGNHDHLLAVAFPCMAGEEARMGFINDRPLGTCPMLVQRGGPSVKVCQNFCDFYSNTYWPNGFGPACFPCFGKHFAFLFILCNLKH